jgi:two-component sensor histidine kinase
VEAESIPVLIDIAIPCGLVVNEILSNALKHAFINERDGEIKIRLSRTQGGMIRLEISDNGMGIPASVDIHHKDSLGVQTIFSIAGQQLGGQVEVETANGVTWRIQFSEDRYHPRV